MGGLRAHGPSQRSAGSPLSRLIQEVCTPGLRSRDSIITMLISIQIGVLPVAVGWEPAVEGTSMAECRTDVRCRLRRRRSLPSFVPVDSQARSLPLGSLPFGPPGFQLPPREREPILSRARTAPRVFRAHWSEHKEPGRRRFKPHRYGLSLPDPDLAKMEETACDAVIRTLLTPRDTNPNQRRAR